MESALFDPWTLAIVATVFTLAGAVKGVIGLGLPTVSLALLVLVLPITEAIALMIIPSIVTNIWQGAVGGRAMEIVKRLWPMFILTCLTVWIGAGVLVGADALIVTGVLGLLLALYSGYSLTRPQVPPPGRHEVWMTPAVGAVAGFFTGLTGSFVVPGTLYLQALGLPRDTLVQAMGIAFTICTAALWVAMGARGLLGSDVTLVSAGALIPATLGMVAGQRLRRLLPEATFRKVFFAALLAMGLFLVARAVS
jgi:uncharacterized membrane protein YfcA